MYAWLFLGLPIQNPSGLYAVKLFWMGAWRRVMVDDHVGVDTVQTDRKRRGHSAMDLSTLVKGLIKSSVCASSDEIWQSVLVGFVCTSGSVRASGI